MANQANAGANAKGKCDKCGNDIEYSKIICDFCGSRLPWAAAATPSAPAQPVKVAPIPVTLTAPPMTASQEKTAQGCGKAMGFGCVGIVALFVVMVVIAMIRPKSAEDYKGTAYNLARSAIRAQLKSPSTAVFPSSYDQGVVILRQNDSFVVSSYVDSQNSFGATLRKRWVANVKGDNHKNMVVTTAQLIE